MIFFFFLSEFKVFLEVEEVNLSVVAINPIVAKDSFEPIELELPLLILISGE